MDLVLPADCVGVGSHWLRRAEGTTPIFGNDGLHRIGVAPASPTAPRGEISTAMACRTSTDQPRNNAQLFEPGQGRFACHQGLFCAGDLDGDKHGAAWADVDNDGRLDLIQLTGAGQGVGSEPKRLFMNRGKKFEDVAAAMGVVNPYNRARMPLWVDLNRDGRLDLFEGAEARFDDRTPPFTFLRQGEVFVEDAGALKFASRSPVFCVVTELGGDAHVDLVCRVEGKNVASQIFDISTLPAREQSLLPATAFEDIAAGDFDNSGSIDLFLARKNPPGPVALGRPSDNELVADIWIDEANLDKPWGFSFRTTGKVGFRIGSAYSVDALGGTRLHRSRRRIRRS
jgi:hypothetical protein